MFYTFCNEAYAGWLTLLVQSIRRVDRWTPILVHFAGTPSIAERLVGSFGRVTIQTPPVFPPKNISPAKLLEFRAENLLGVAQSLPYDWLMVLDTDLLIRRSLRRLARAMQLYDFAAVIRGAANGSALPPHQEISAALYMLTRSGVPVLERAFALMHHAEEVRGVRRGDWYWDQACLAEAVLTSELRIGTIPRELYLSSRPFDSRAAVWNANFTGERKHAAMKLFARELHRLRNARRRQ